MLNVVFRPLAKWPGARIAEQDRQRSPFSSSYENTLDLLERELFHLRAQNVVIQVALDSSQIRNDGWPKTINAIKDPGVILTFNDPRGDDFSYPCDTYHAFRDNLRAIALALEALRKVDRYGITRRGEQYQGFKALPPPAPGPVPVMSAAEAADYMGELAGVPGASILADSDVFEMMGKLASRRVHPDSADGSHERFVKLQDEMTILKAHFRKAKAAAG